MTQSKTNQKETPRIYVASLADYNAGWLLARWIDANQSPEKLNADIRELLAESKQPPAAEWFTHYDEEWVILKYEGFCDLKLYQYASVEDVATAAQGLAEHGQVFGELANHFGGWSGLAKARKCMEKGYRGEYESLADYTEQYIEKCYGGLLRELPALIRHHLDYEGIGEDIEMYADIFTIELGGKVHVFEAEP